MSSEERTGWRDEAISRWHRTIGFDCPMVDIDFVVAEYDHCIPVAIIEYKHERANPRDFESTHPSIKTLCAMADKAAIPFFVVIYSSDLLKFTVRPMNKLAIAKIPCEKVDRPQRQFVNFLYWLRGRKTPPEILEKLPPIT